MITKEKLINEIENLPEDLLEKVYKFIRNLQTQKPKIKIHTYKLKGQFDDMDVREESYKSF